MKHSMEIACKTDDGCVRELNEDTVQVGLLDGSFANPWLFDAYIVVADGMGGHDGGEVASRLAVKMVEQIFASDQGPQYTLEEVSGQDLLHRLYGAVQEINRVVHSNGHGEGTARAGTTLTLCLVRRHEYGVAHVGDSRAYLVRAGSIEQVTADDSWVAEAVARGLMTEEEARHSEFRNRITKAIGLQEEIEPSVYYGQWQPGDVLLVCSDGLSEYIPAPELLELTRRCSGLQQLCHECIRLSRERGGHDNISIAVVKNGAGDAGQGGASSTPRRPVTWPPAGGAIADEERAAPYAQKPYRSTRASSSSISWNWRQIKLLALGVLLLLAFLLAGLWMGRRSVQVKHKTQGRTVSQEFRLRNLPPLSASERATGKRPEAERRTVRQNPRREKPRKEPIAATVVPGSTRENRRREEGRRDRPDQENHRRHREENTGTLPAPARPPGNPDKAKPKPKPTSPPPAKPEPVSSGKHGADKNETSLPGKSPGGGSDAASIGVGVVKPSPAPASPGTSAEREDKDKSPGGGTKPAEPALASKPSPEKTAN